MKEKILSSMEGKAKSHWRVDAYREEWDIVSLCIFIIYQGHNYSFSF